MSELREETGCVMLKCERCRKTRGERDSNQRIAKPERQPGSICSAKRSQKGLRVEANKFTSMKSQKTDSVSTDSTKRTLGLTPRFSPFPSVLDLPNGERIASTG